MTAALSFLRDNAAFLLAGALLSFTSSFGQTFFISIFAGEIMSTFSLSDGDWGLIYSLGTTASAIVMVWSGVLTDRLRVRVLGAIVFAGLAFACLFMAFNPYAAFLPLSIFLLRFTGQGMTSHIAMVAMARWFVATRGKALAIAASGYAVGEAILPVLFVAAMTLIDWHYLWMVAALFILLMLPVMQRLLRQERTPQSLAESDNALGMNGRHWTRKEMLRHPLFWFVLPSILGPSAFVTALFFQQVHLAEVKGWSHVGFVALFPVYTGVSTLFMLLAGWAIDRFGTKRLMPFYQIPIAISFVVMASAESLWGAALAFALMAMTTGANSTLPSAFWAEFYGTRHIGGIKSIATAAMVLGSAIGPAISGVLIDRGITFPEQMLGITMWFLLASGLIWFGVTTAARSLARPA
ncbi:nitrate/nitrite transporter [Nioella sp. MMSF_3534]|uniref:MFS transporter n=1 Tax=Nioella sp. MMSF_3534 TaxID=3046720 RepID=UPI00273E8D99|nr:MFS transporter [Nioella sp. MMSF_3534]